MDVRYQVFVSSTFVDLQNERTAVFQTLMEMDCIPAGMELFPAMDEQQWAFIRRVVDDCDYYILILGSRYGSVSEAGISFTEMEYDYAVAKGLKVLAFVHEHPDDRPLKLGESDPALRDKLQAFRTKVCTGRLVRFWNETKELPGLVALSLNKTIRTYPAIGWVRADKITTEQATREQNEILRENEALRKEVDSLKSNILQAPIDLAPLDSLFNLRMYCTIWTNNHKRTEHVAIKITWLQIFSALAPDLLSLPNDAFVSGLLREALRGFIDHRRFSDLVVNAEDFKTIRTQLTALGLIQPTLATTTGGAAGLFWHLTERGTALMLQERTVRIPGGAIDE